MSGLLKNLFFALGLALILWLGYVVFIQEDSPSLSAENSLVTSQAVRDSQEFLATLQQLRTIEIDESFFSSPEFSSLVDHRQDIVDEPYGRENPFVPFR